MSKLGNKIKEIRLLQGLSQEEFAKGLGYTSKSTINKIELGINEISYDKLMLLISKYDLSFEQFLESNNEIPIPKEEFSNLYISFSARSNGNCEDIIKYMMSEKDSFVSFKDLSYNACHKCNYECMNENKCKYRDDDIYTLLGNSLKYNKIVFVVPMYCSNPSSLYFVLMERMQDYFNNNEFIYEKFINKIHIVALYGSDEETPLFVPLLTNGLKKGRCLPIQRHKYNLKVNDLVIANPSIKMLIDNFKKTVSL